MHRKESVKVTERIKWKCAIALESNTVKRARAVLEHQSSLVEVH